ncbi:MAG: hypothetical protein L3J43_06175 [Sulfurovum sp.]|nr:hypothetical protein [Sulfurovum sp.]
MNLIFSIFYAPFVFILLKFYDIKMVSMIIFSISMVWLFVLKDKKDISLLFPLFYITIAIFAFFSQAFLVLKTIPLLLALFFSAVILISYFQERSMILDFAEKMSKEPLGEEEIQYIHQSSIFWFFVSIINICIHFYFYLNTNLDFWLFYSSVGWYFLFLFAGIFQYIHRRFIFLRRGDV